MFSGGNNGTAGQESFKVNLMNHSVTCARDADGDTAVFTFHLSAILILAAICIFGNSVVIFVMLKEKSLQSPLNHFITSLAVSDLAQGIIYTVYNIGHINVDIIRNTIGHWSVCCPLLLMVVTTLASSPFNVVAITVVRYMSIRWPLRHKHLLTKSRIQRGIALIWVLAFAYGVLFYARSRPVGYCGVCRSELHWQYHQVFAMLIFSAAIPFSVMITLHCMMAKTYSIHVRTMTSVSPALQRDAPSNKSFHAKSRQNEKTLSRVSTFLVTYFFLSYIPFILYTLVHKLCNCTINGYLRSSVRILLFSNTTVNFFAYIFTHPAFRYAIVKMFCRNKYLAAKRSSVNRVCSRQSDSHSCIVRLTSVSALSVSTLGSSERTTHV